MPYEVTSSLCCYTTGIEDLCTRRNELHKQILEEEEEKVKLQNDIRLLTERLAKVNESLSKKMSSRAEYDRTIAETEAAYAKVDLAAVLFSDGTIYRIVSNIAIVRSYRGISLSR